jgi:predicted amidohydrolase YtcJ
MSIHPDVVFTRGKIVTVDPRFSVAQAFAIRGDRIEAVGTATEIEALAGPGTRIVDLHGRTVMPGIHDVHFQMFDRACAQYFGCHVNLPETIGDVLDALRDGVKPRPRGAWVSTNPGWYPHMLRENRVPTLAELDAIAPDHKLVVWGESYYLNSNALRASGLTRDTPQPKYGWIGKDAAGELTGALYGSAHKLIHPDYNRYSDAERLEAIEWALTQMLSMGVTSLRDPKRFPAQVRLYQRLYREGRLPLRLCAQVYIESHHAPEEVIANLERFQLGTPLGDHWFKIDRSGYFYVDGGYHRMKIDRPYANVVPGTPDDGESHFEPEQSHETLEKIVVGMARRGFTGSIMAAGNVATEIVTRVLERAHDEVGIADKRWVVAHAIYPSREQLARLARVGAVLTPMWHHYYYYPVQEFYHGRELAQRTEPYRDVVEAGIVLAQGTDVSTIPLNYFPGLYFTVTRDTWKWGPANPGQGLTREQALRTFTSNCAYATFDEQVKGSLEPGKLADFVVLSEDVLTCPDARLKELRALATVIGGELRYRAAEFTDRW